MKKILSILVTAILLSSCSSFLEEDNKAGITNDDLYATEDGYQTLRVNAYAGLRTIYGSAPLVMLAGTDLYQMPRGMTNNGVYDYTTLYDTNSDVATFYDNCYTVLQAVNTAEYYLPTADISDDDKDLYQGEYDFFKGFLHFILLEEFGGVVINDEYTQAPRMNMPRASLSDSYDYIIGKLESALKSSLPQTAKDGQICKDIVNHYLAKVYLTRGWDLGDADDFATAKTYAKAVLDSRGDLKYSMEELWSPDNENNDEVLFAIQYSIKSIATSTSGNNQESVFGPYLGGSELGHKYMSGLLYPSWSLHSWYGKNDARYDATFMLTIWEHYYDYYQGNNVPGTNAIAAIYPRAWDNAEEMFNDYLQLTGGEANGEFVDITMNDENKQLVDGALEFLEKWCPEYSTEIVPVNAIDENGNNILRIYPFIEHSSDHMVNEKYWRTAFNNDFAQPGIKKFDLGHLETFSTTQSYRDIVLASLSETMLLYAEACIGEGSYAEAETYINKVLARPGNAKDGNNLTISLPTTQDAALEAYLKESGKELAGQYCGRWPELRRTGMLKTMFYGYNYDYLTGNLGTDPIGEKLYRPIPQSAIEINEGLTADDQNLGYY